AAAPGQLRDSSADERIRAAGDSGDGQRRLAAERERNGRSVSRSAFRAGISVLCRDVSPRIRTGTLKHADRKRLSRFRAGRFCEAHHRAVERGGVSQTTPAVDEWKVDDDAD